jgi:hypothetical protein
LGTRKTVHLLTLFADIARTSITAIGNDRESGGYNETYKQPQRGWRT